MNYSLGEDTGQEPQAKQLHMFVVSQEISCQHTDLLSLDPAAVRSGCLASLQQPTGIRLLEEALLRLMPTELSAKRIRGKGQPPPDVLRWIELAK